MGREIRFPMDTLFDSTYSSNIDAESYANWVQESLRVAMHGARENLQTAKQQQKHNTTDTLQTSQDTKLAT